MSSTGVAATGWVAGGQESMYKGVPTLGQQQQNEQIMLRKRSKCQWHAYGTRNARHNSTPRSVRRITLIWNAPRITNERVNRCSVHTARNVMTINQTAGVRGGNHVGA